MAILFSIEDGLAKPHDETLLIEPFRTIWRKDTSRKKLNAIRDFTYIEFMCSKLATNPYRGFEEKARRKKLKETVMKDPKYKETKEVLEGMKVLQEFQTKASVSYGLYIDAEKAAHKLREFFRNFDINERNEKGVPIWKPRDITSALQDVDKTITALEAIKRKVEEQLFETVKRRAQKKVSIFADPSSLL